MQVRYGPRIVVQASLRLTVSYSSVLMCLSISLEWQCRSRSGVDLLHPEVGLKHAIKYLIFHLMDYLPFAHIVLDITGKVVLHVEGLRKDQGHGSCAVCIEATSDRYQKIFSA